MEPFIAQVFVLVQETVPLKDRCARSGIWVKSSRTETAASQRLERAAQKLGARRKPKTSRPETRSGAIRDGGVHGVRHSEGGERRRLFFPLFLGGAIQQD